METELEWVRVFPSLEIAESSLELNVPRALKYRDHRLCLIRNSDGIRAFFDECPHKRVPLSRGSCPTGKEIVCYLHSYIYHLETGQEMEGNGGELTFYPVKHNEDGVFIGFPSQST